VDRIVNMRKSATNIDALRSLGVKVTYHAAAVTDTDAVKQSVADHDTIHGFIQTILKERGLEFLPLDQGLGFFMAGLMDKTEVEVIISGLDYSFDRDGLLGEPNHPVFPFLDDMVSKDDTRVEFKRTGSTTGSPLGVTSQA
jgi:hypothetical protein